MISDRLRRVTDLFVEGAEVYLGMDEEHRPILIWVNKLNSFEVEEARRDGVAARGVRLIELAKADNPERMAVELRLNRMSDSELREARVGQRADELYLGVINDLESDSEWAEKIATLRRLPTLLEDSGAPPDDERRRTLDELNASYLQALNEGTRRKQAEALADLAEVGRDQLIEDYLDSWRNRVTLDDFMAERRSTEIFMAARDCRAVEAPGSTTGNRVWDHGGCDHSQRLLNERSEVRSLPETVLAKVSDALEQLTVSARESGNSGAPVSSSASSEPSSASEEALSPSTPAGTPAAAHTT